MNNRIEEIMQMIQNDSRDPFLWYILALEYQKAGEKNKTGETFRRLLSQFPDYLPTYYHAAHFFWQTGSMEEVKATFLKGIILAEKNLDIKTTQELKNAYQNFLIEVVGE